jgi:methylamine dehydrogenase accessory protein MauD
VSGWWTASYVVLWALVIVLCAVVVALARQIGTLHLRLGPRGALEIDDEGPPIGDAPPVVVGQNLDGSAVEVGGPGARRLLLFVSPGCILCEQVLPALPVVARVNSMKPVAITDVDPIEAARDLRVPRGVTAVSGPDVAMTYQVPGTPYAVVMDKTGVVRAKGTINNLEQFEGLVATASRRESDALEVAG